ncbi:hypothetical protein EMPS_05993 [Entomortierella parvispora]|uniref:Uncharacterized protein n=1 Tax=Entomortierella parvispora TaxID=205924 RepID=A0A9P3HBF8_9FUNG|nr:hypothetical protein EMPS_05993 [Entomortierella parvispora]
MTVMFHPMRPKNRRRATTGTPSGSIQPSVKVILDLAAYSEQHDVTLYYLPTHGTSGFTSSHTILHRQRTGSTKYLSDRPIAEPTENCQGDGAHQKDSSRIQRLTRVSESDRGIVHLARLRITSLSIATSSLPHLSRLVSLRLQGNRLTELPPQIFRLVSLQELDVSQNLLTEISGLIGMLAPTLRELFLQSNHLEYLPQQLGRLKRLRLLDLADNRLRCIPVEVQRLVAESCSPQRSRDEEAPDSPGASVSQDIHSIGLGVAHGSSSPQSLEAAEHDEAGGHDDDDYVQIRQGMKCWARGNRFWQVGVPWSSSNAPTSVIDPSNVGTSTTLYLHSVILDSPNEKHTSGKNSFDSLSRTEPGVTGIGVRWAAPQPAPFSPNGPSHQHPRHSKDTSLRIQQQPGHLVDRADYVKDSYTSCSWTLSLADICSQIAGERLHKEPHYFCRGRGCTTKGARSKDAISGSGSGTERPCSLKAGDGECSVAMMPQWAVEILGLQDIIDQHDPLASESMGSEDDLAHHGNHLTTPEERAQGTLRLTLAEREMQSDHCSVCRKRLYFEGMRWKDVGVMDERIVPLEWVACSVQCRARAEKTGGRGVGQESSTDSDTDTQGNLSGMAGTPEEETFFFHGFDQVLTEPVAHHYQQQEQQQQQRQQQEYPSQMSIEDRLSLRYGLSHCKSGGEDTENRTHSL